MNNRQNRFSYKLVCYQFILSVLVVFIHAVNYDPDILIDNAKTIYLFGNTVSYIGNVAVPCFFTLSGFLFYFQFQWDKLLPKLKRRFFTLLLPFVIWNSIIYFSYLLLSKLPGLYLGHMDFSLRAYVSAVINSDYSPLWFIKTLVVYVILTPAVVYLWKREWIAIFSIVALIFTNYMGISTRYVSNYYLPMYLLGAYFALYHPEIITGRSTGWLRWTATVCLAGVLLLSALYVPLGLGEKWLYTLRLLGVVSVWFALDWFRFENSPGKWMQVSFAIYAMHCVLIKVGKTLVYYYLPHTWWALLGEFVLLPGITVAAIVGINCILSRNRYTQRIWRIMLGNR